MLAPKVRRYFDPSMTAHLQPADAEAIRAVWNDAGRSHADLDLSTIIDVCTAVVDRLEALAGSPPPAGRSPPPVPAGPGRQIVSQDSPSGVFDRKPPSEKPWTQKLWIYDFRTNQNFTLKTRALVRADLDDFVACYNPADRHERTETERFRAFSYDELVARDKASLGIFWLRGESLEDTALLVEEGYAYTVPGRGTFAAQRDG